MSRPRVQILYFEGCPNSEAALDHVRQALALEGAVADVHRNVDAARRGGDRAAEREAAGQADALRRDPAPRVPCRRGREHGDPERAVLDRQPGRVRADAQEARLRIRRQRLVEREPEGQQLRVVQLDRGRRRVEIDVDDLPRRLELHGSLEDAHQVEVRDLARDDEREGVRDRHEERIRVFHRRPHDGGRGPPRLAELSTRSGIR